MGSHFNRNALPSKDKAPRVWIVVMASIIFAILCVVGVKAVGPLLGGPVIILLFVLYVKCGGPSNTTD